MAIDSSIYGNLQSLDLAGGFEKGMKLGEMIKARNEQNSIKQALAKNSVTDANGGVSFNQGGLVSDLMQVNPEMAFQYQQQFKAQDMANQKAQADKQIQQLDLIGRLAGSATDQNTYSSALSQARTMGLDVSQMPETYDANLVKSYQMQALSSKDRLEQHWKEKDYALKARELDIKDKASKGAQSDMKNFVPGIGVALNEDDAKKLKDSRVMKEKFDRQIGELINLRKEYGVEYANRDAVARGKQLSKDLLLTYKNLAKLGVLSKSDEDIVNAIIPADPLGQDFALGQDPILHTLEKFQSDLDSDYNTTLSTRVKTPIMGQQAGAGGAGKPQTVVQNGYTYTLNPQTGEYE